MNQAKLRAATVGGSAEDTEAAFYEALARGDVERLMACWAEEDDIVCVLPGGARLLGAGAIRAAFTTLLAQGALQARATQVHRVQALASSVHSVVEQVQVMLPDGPHQAIVQATNVYHKTPQGWRMVAHHASPGVIDVDAGSAPAAQTLH